ncbi:hypothetical protein BsWGS_05964 [Bradybaena similaris]
MALFQKIFSTKRGPRSFSNDTNARRNDPSQKTVPPKLDKSNIRLVVYAETDRGRTPYFDSNAITCIEEIDKNVIKSAPKTMRARAFNHPAHREGSLPPHRPNTKYHFQKLGNDVKVLEEMMFGTVAMAFKGLTLKVHLLRSPPQLMVSKVFIPEKPNRDSANDVESDSISLPSSSADFSSGEFYSTVAKTNEKPNRSIPVDVPTKEMLSDYSTDDDSGLASFTSSGSLRTSFPSPSNNSLSSYSSLHRRWMRAQTTSLDGHHRKDSSLASESTLSRPHRNKLAIGIIFGSSDEKDEDSNELFQSFFFSHFALIEGHVEKLRSVVEKAYFNSRNFLPAIMEALHAFRNDVYDLFMAPRLPEPVWLTMMSTTSYKTKLCEKFMETFVSLVTKYDNKNCKFFVSTLLSAVLTQHLAWVATVTPAGGTPSHTYLDKHTAKWVDALAKTHPYNPLWAQLGDLYGAIGLPLKISRTVVVGKKADVVIRFLYILSYFIRCSEVQENSDPQCLSNIVNDTQFDSSLSPTLSEKTLIDVLERSTSPIGSGMSVFRQNSNGSSGSGGMVSQKLNSVDSLWGHSRHKLDVPFEESGDDSSSKVHSKSAVVHGSSPSKTHASCCLERSDSGYNGANFECSCEQEPKPLTSICADNVGLVGKTALEINQCNNVLSSSKNVFCEHEFHPHLNHVHSDSVILPSRPHCNDGPGDFMMKDISSVKSKTQTSASNSTAGVPMGMSELFNYEPDPFPVACIDSSKIIESPRVERVMLASRAAAPARYDTPDCAIVTAEPLARSHSFSEGKVRSRLTQRLDKGLDDVGDAEYKMVATSAGSSSSWLSGESRNEAEPNKLIISRQTSQDSKLQGRPSNLGKSRPITPTELSRRRHLSSTGSIDYEAFDPMIHCKEIKIPNSLTESGQWHIKAFDRNFGHSLLAGYTDHYMSDFVLHGTSDTNFKPRLLNDLQMAVRHSVLDEPINEAVCVIADTDSWTVEVASSKVMGMSPSGCTSWSYSQLVADLIESVVEISKLKMSAEFCLMHVEDRLQEIYFKSLMLSENLRATTTYSQRELTAMLGFESSDMPLLLAIAGTLTPVSCLEASI